MEVSMTAHSSDRRVLSLALACAASLACSPKGPTLTLLHTGDGLGEIEPCG